jgi:hypothetical protein
VSVQCSWPTNCSSVSFIDAVQDYGGVFYTRPMSHVTNEKSSLRGSWHLLVSRDVVGDP